MKTSAKFVLTIGLALTVLSCGNASREDRMSAKEATEEAKNDSIISANGFVPSSAAVEKNKDTTRKFIRMAEMKFRVDNVARKTFQIEDLTSQMNGFVTYTDLISHIDYQTITPVSADSSVETIHYTVSNIMTIRVPNTKLDSTLKSIALLIDYLDYRVIKASDVGLQIFANQLAQKRVAKHEERLKTAIATQGKKLNETTGAEENIFDKQEQADNAKINNLSLQDQISFSTINLILYQRQDVKRTIFLNEKNTAAYEPGFGTKLVESLTFGLNILESFFIFISKFWGLALFAIVLYALYRKYNNDFKTKK